MNINEFPEKDMNDRRVTLYKAVSSQKMKTEVESAIKQMENSTDVKKIEKLKDQLQNLEAIGGYDAIAPSEGLVFAFNDKVYKLVGTFQPIHHIISLLKYS